MIFWIYSLVIPIIILTIMLFVYKPLTFASITKAGTVAIVPLVIYMLLIYFLETEQYINSGWSFYTLFIYLFPYIGLILVLNLMVKRKKRK